MAKSAKTFLTVQELSQPHRQKPFPSPLIKINLDFSQSNYSKNLDIVLKIPLKCKKNSCWDFIKGDPKVNIYRRANMSQIFGYKNGVEQVGSSFQGLSTYYFLYLFIPFAFSFSTTSLSLFIPYFFFLYLFLALSIFLVFFQSLVYYLSLSVSVYFSLCLFQILSLSVSVSFCFYLFQSFLNR